MPTILIAILVGIVAFIAYCLYERHKYFNKYKLKKESRADYVKRKEHDQRYKGN